MLIVEECCCGCSLKSGSILIGVFYLLGSIGQSGSIAKDLFFISSDDEDWTEWVTTNEPILQAYLGCGAVHATVAIFLIVVATLEKSVLILSWTIMEIPVIIANSVLGIMVFKAYHELEEELTFSIVLIFFVTVCMLLTVYYLLVVYSYYKLLLLKRRASRF